MSKKLTFLGFSMAVDASPVRGALTEEVIFTDGSLPIRFGAEVDATSLISQVAKLKEVVHPRLLLAKCLLRPLNRAAIVNNFASRSMVLRGSD
ncbi:hypothetical protein [Bythopirellula polymerisocia]|uniref:Uncharacterized protein n=1 Tax=Bythopirellula polymerisocia TaxID=2528003 RepID=A0A5C6CST0_9BACT|nr:hypothetical protein [Bythopirellula polymerisocia]TWU27620.1 hypothetical protein Pla144_23970 [Bythopirellula polymerisocia]